MEELRFSGAIAGVGTASGTRFVVGRWDTSPFGTFADVMVEDRQGHRTLLAPTPQLADFVARTYVFDEVCVTPVDVTVADRTWAVRAGDHLTAELVVGRTEPPTCMRWPLCMAAGEAPTWESSRRSIRRAGSASAHSCNPLRDAARHDGRHHGHRGAPLLRAQAAPQRRWRAGRGGGAPRLYRAWNTGLVRPVNQSRKLQNVRYDVRGPILEEAHKLEAEGHRIMKLNIGNPAPFGFEAPESILVDMIHNLPEAQGYSDSRGIFSARTAVAHFYQEEGLKDVTVEDVFIGNGVSEMISLVLQALVDNGDEILIPAPDYPLWTAAVTLAGGTPVHYLCDEEDGWNPSLEDVESRITDRTKAIVLINPNNPTGAVYSQETVKGFVELATKHDLVVLADEIYEKILYDGARHHHAATYAHDILCLTFSGLSKAYRVAGFRSGWVVVTGARQRAGNFLEGLTLLANMRMCANVPAQHAIQTALGGYQSIRDLILPGGRLLAQRDLAHRLITDIPGVTCVKPQGALYLFPRLDPQVYPIEDDQAFVIDLLRATHILITNGTGFNWPTPDHVRIVTLPSVQDLEFAIGRIAEFLATQR